MKTVSLELSKQLKQSGYPQKAAYFYLDGGLADEMERDGRFKEYASPTADEILDQLPYEVNKNTLKVLKTIGGEYAVMYGDTEMTFGWSMSLADLAAKMYLYLKKKGLL